MALVRALNSGISGLSAQQTQIDVIGDNLANVDTTAFKAARVDFQTLLSQTLSGGSPPAGNLGGVDPQQIGLGVLVGATTKNFSQGSLKATGIKSDLAIEGDGFFVLKDASGAQVFTRDGSFALNPQNQLHDPKTGFKVQGWNADLSTFQINTGAPVTDVTIPVGTLRIAKATQNVDFSGNFNSNGDLALNGTVLESTSPFTDTSLPPGNTANNLTLLTNLGRSDPSGTVSLLINPGDTISVSAEKGGRDLPVKTFGVGPGAPNGVDATGTTFGDFVGFLQNALEITPSGFNGQLLQSAERTGGTIDLAQGDSVDPVARILTDTDADFVAKGVQPGDILRFNSGPGASQEVTVQAVLSPTQISFSALDPSKPTPGAPPGGDEYSIHERAKVSIGGTAAGEDPASPEGTIRISGNAGSQSEISNLVITVKHSGGTTTNFGLFNEKQQATGESVQTTETVFDSLGTSHVIENTYYLDFKTPGGTQWRWLANTEANFGADKNVGTGLVTFNNNGQFVSDLQGPVSVDLDTSGAATPLQVKLNHSKTTSFGNQQSEVNAADQDGFAQGTLDDFSVDSTGVVKGIFTNGITRDVAQVALARFDNNEGLVSKGDNVFGLGVNSGLPSVGPSQQAARGAIRGGFLEESNVDIAAQFTDLIVAQRAFQANARTITVASSLLQDLIQIQ